VRKRIIPREVEAVLFAFAVAIIAQLEPGPLDALRANHAATRVRLHVERTSGSLAKDEFSEERAWKGELGFVVDPRLTIAGVWASDGEAEYFALASPGWKPDQAPKGSATGAAGLLVPKEQLLFDGEMTVRRRGDDSRVDVMLTDNPSLGRGIGPYCWDSVAPFPLILKLQFPDYRPRRYSTMCNGHPTEAEIYRRDQSDGWHQLEVYYDVDSGYVPRFVRLVKSARDQDIGFVRSTYIISMRGCREGGLVPAEWYSVFFVIPGFEKKYPQYKAETPIKPSGQFSVSRFRVTDFADLDRPVRLEDDKGVAVLSSFGGQVPATGLANSLTIANVRRALGPKLKVTAASLPHLDRDEVANRSHPSRWRWTSYMIALVVAAGCAIRFGWSFWRRQVAASMLLALALFSAPGCGLSTRPVVNITGSFAQPQVIHEPNASIPMELILKNDGNQAVRITHVDGGCSCRQVDQSPLPMMLKPGKSLALGVKMVAGKRFEPLNIMFTAESDQGRLTVPALVYAMPSQHMSPEAPANDSLVGDQPWEFELVHRSVFRRSDARPANPPAPASRDGTFRLVKESSHIGEVDEAPDFVFEDTTYKVALLNRSLGLHKAVIDLSGPDGGVRLEVPVTWRRSSYLSSVPDRAVLGSRPVRIFLRCPDQGVELTSVLDTPEGIKAVISGPRELTLSLSEGAPGIIKGNVRVKTTAAGLEPLLVPVVRYKPVAMR
jgi:hypothetical protein